MRPDAVQYIGAYFFSIVGGYFIVAWIMRFLRWRLRHPDKGNELDFWLGSTERAVATTLVILAPKYVGPFIGGWIALKMAANWQRLKGDSVTVRQGTLLALIGNVCSFTVAIAAGVLLVNRHALEVWAE